MATTPTLMSGPDYEIPKPKAPSMATTAPTAATPPPAPATTPGGAPAAKTTDSTQPGMKVGGPTYSATGGSAAPTPKPTDYSQPVMRTGITTEASPVPSTPSVPGLMNWQAGFEATNTGPAQREVGASELAGTHLDALTSGDSKYIRNARLGAREQASNSGMLTSSIAAGASTRAAIDAAMPIAQQQAEAYRAAASENLGARAADQQADQGQARELLTRDLDRMFQSGESALQRNFTAAENEAARKFQSGEALTEREWRTLEAARDREFSGSQSDAARQQERQNQYFALVANREQQLSATLQSIYSNPNLTAAQQQAAAENARAISESIFNSFSSVLAAGIPPIFQRPYEMTFTNPAPPAGG